MTVERSPRALYSFPHTLGKPGISTTARYQIEGLLDAGVDLTVICTFSMITDARARFVQTLELAGRRIPHRAFLSTQRAYDHHDRMTARLLRREQFDLVHVWPRACLRTLATARRLGVPSFREVPSPHIVSALREAGRAAAERGLELPATHSHAPNEDLVRLELAEFEAADHLLVPSAYAGDTFLAEGIAAQRLVGSQYGFDPALFGPGEPAGAGRVFTALFLGRGEPNKGLHLALQAWFDSGAAQTGTLLVAGTIWPPYGDQLAEQLQHPSVQVLGFVRDTPALLARADVLLLPSYTEGSALVTYEAMGSGCVPLVSVASGAPVRDGSDGFVHEVGDVQTLTSQLSRLASDPQAMARMRVAALARRDDLTWSAAGQRLARAYRSVLAADPVS